MSIFKAAMLTLIILSYMAEEKFSPSGVKTSDMMFLVGCWNVFVWLDTIDNSSHKILIFDCWWNMLQREITPHSHPGK